MKRGSLHGVVCLALAAALLVPTWRASSAFAAEGAQVSEKRSAVSKKRAKKPAPATPSLYERLGGINNIAPLVDDVIERSYASEVFKANPRIEEAHKRFPKAVYKYNATSLACMVMGGPQKYTGRSLKEAHQHLQVTEKEWQELISIFRESMNGFKVPPKEQAEVIAIIESTKGDVVVPVKAAVNP
jgi:hemoglobin